MSFLAHAYQAPNPDIVDRYFAFGEDSVDAWPADKLARYHREALFKSVLHAWDNNAFYRKKLVAAGVVPTSLDLPVDLHRLPLTTADELSREPWTLLAVARHQVAQIHLAADDQGRDIYVPYTWSDLHVTGLAPAMRRLLPIDETDRVVNALRYELGSAGLGFHRLLQRSCGALVYPAGNGGFYSTPERTLRAAKDLQATVLLTTPAFALAMAEAAVREGIALDGIPLRQLWLIAEECTRGLRERIEALWGRKARLYFGSAEAGPIGIECAERRGYHLAAGHSYVEVVNPRTGENVAQGEPGEIVVTELTRRGSSLIRFRTGDIAHLEVAPCPCGIALPRLHVA